MTDDPIALCLEGRIAPNVALARLALRGAMPEAIADLLAPHAADPRAAPLRALLAGRAAALRRLAALGRSVDHDRRDASAAASLAATRALFDRAARQAPEASVAAYTLGEPDLLAAATAELVDWLDGQGLLGASRDVLDLGCGIGRVAAALAPRVRSVLGVDIAPFMVAEAQRRHGAVPGLRFAVAPGDGLGWLRGQAFGLVLAVDSIPYLMQAGPALAERHIADAASLLRPGGALAVLNLSYRGDPEADIADASRWAASHGFDLACAGAQPFTLWDGTAFVLRRPE